MAYSEVKLQNNGDRTSPCFKPFRIGNLHVSVSLIHFIGIPDSVRILYNTSH
jgi:hypothetical protein